MQASVDRQPRPRAAQVGEEASSDLQVDVSLNKNGSQENQILRKGTRQLKEQAMSYGYFFKKDKKHKEIVHLLLIISFGKIVNFYGEKHNYLTCLMLLAVLH